MKIYLLLITFFVFFQIEAASNYKLYYEKSEGGFNIYADNDEYCPISIKVNFKLTNMFVKNGNNKVYILQAKTKKQLIANLIRIGKHKLFKFSYTYNVRQGDVTIKKYSNAYKYYLPFKKSKSFTVSQGYHGAISHQNENAIDFTMPIGTEIVAVRDGVVVKIVQNNIKNCKERACMKYNNYITLYHNDGTFAEYTHIKKNGSKVKVGEKIKKGQVIAYSGNVGWSTGPHLHLVIYLPRMKTRKTLETKFLINNGELATLKEKENYVREY